MEIVNKILSTIAIVAGVIFVIIAIFAIVLYLEIKVLIRKRDKLKEEYSREELRLFEIQAMVTNLTASVNSYILEIMRKRQELRDRKCNCSHSPASNTENQTT